MVVYFFLIVKEDSSDVPFYHHRATKKNYIHRMNNYYKISIIIELPLNQYRPSLKLMNKW